MRAVTLALALAACAPELPRERIVEPMRRWLGDDTDAGAGLQVVVGGFGAGGDLRLLVAAPDSINAGVPSPPGRVYALDPAAPDGHLYRASEGQVVAPYAYFGNHCLRDLGDLDGDGVHDVGVCTLEHAYIFRGPIDASTSPEEPLAVFTRAATGSYFPFLVEDMAVMPGGHELVLSANHMMARFDTPVAGEYAAPVEAGPEVVTYMEGHPSEFAGTSDLRVLADRNPPLLAFVASYPYTQHKGVGIFEGWPESGSWDEARRWHAGPPFYSVFGVETGDVDGDGLHDVIALSHTQNRLAILTDPTAAGGELDDAPITIHGPEMEPIDGFGGFLPREWFGTGAAVGDLDHDGVDDLVVGAPGNAYFDADPGVFAVYLGPLEPGHYTLDDADLVARDGDTPNDGFGAYPTIADLDGDGWNELVIGSPNADVGLMTDAGMVTTYADLFGRPPRRRGPAAR